MNAPPADRSVDVVVIRMGWPARRWLVNSRRQPRVLGVESRLVGGEFPGHATATPDWTQVAGRIRDDASDTVFQERPQRIATTRCLLDLARLSTDAGE